MLRAAVLLSAVALLAAPPPDIEAPVLDAMTRLLKFTPAEFADLDRGRIVRHALDANAPGEVAVVGAVRVNARKSGLLEQVRNIAEFKKGNDVLQIGRFSDPPALHDLDGLTVTSEDFDPSDCRVTDCDVRLPADAIERLRAEMDGQRGSAPDRAASWFKRVLFDHVTAYWTGSPGRITSYDDGTRPIHPVTEFEGLIRNSPSLGLVAPGLPEHLLHFPSSHLEGAEDFLYWSKEKFGVAPFITVTHVSIICRTERTCVVASKDVYSSRYIDASLALTIATDTSTPDSYYLVYANRSRANALKGRFSGLKRAIVERRARGSIEETLRALKGRLERAR